MDGVLEELLGTVRCWVGWRWGSVVLGGAMAIFSCLSLVVYQERKRVFEIEKAIWTAFSVVLCSVGSDVLFRMYILPRDRRNERLRRYK